MTGARHGTYGAYIDGCRCSPCRRANAAYMRAYRRRKHAGRTVPYPAQTPFKRSGLGWPA